MQTFAYETTENGARILRCFSCDKRVEIPERLEGLIVREIGDYAFSVHFDEAAFKLGQARGVSGLHRGSFGGDMPLEGEEVEEVILPPSVEKVGAYCFYNCSNLRLWDLQEVCGTGAKGRLPDATGYGSWTTGLCRGRFLV